MNHEPEIRKMNSKKLVGMSIKMSLIGDRTRELFQTFMPQRKMVPNKIDTKVYDLRVYPINYFKQFDPSTPFTKYVLVEVDENAKISLDMETYDLASGTYAVFKYKGTKGIRDVYEYIFTTWLPKSNYELDDRPFFEILDINTKSNDTDIEEETWIPIKLP